MSKFHINPATGAVNPCQAQAKCPFGGADAHFDSVDDAYRHYDAMVRRDNDPATHHLPPPAGKPAWHRPQDSYPTAADRIDAAKAQREAAEANAQRRSVSGRLRSALGRVKENTADAFSFDNVGRTAVIAGVATSILVGGGLLWNTNHQSYEPVNADVTHSKVTTTMVPVKIGKITTLQAKKTTKTDFVTATGEAGKVTEGGSHKHAEGSEMLVFKVDGKTYTATRPGSTEAQAYSVAGGAMAGMGAAMLTIGAGMALEQREDNRRFNQHYGR